MINRADPIITEDIIKAAASSAGAAKTWALAKFLTTEIVPDGPSNGNSQFINGANADIVFNNPGLGNIPYDETTGIFTLAIGKTYRLTTNLYIDGISVADDYFTFAWVGSVSNSELVPGAGVVWSVDSTGTNNTTGLCVGDVIHVVTDAASALVKVRCLATNGDDCLVMYGSNAIILEL